VSLEYRERVIFGLVGRTRYVWMLLGKVLKCNKIRREEEKEVIQDIYSNRIRQGKGQETEAEQNTRGFLAKERKENKGEQKEMQEIYIVYRFEPKPVHLQPLGRSSNIQ
jgi:hypothetical protein